MGTTADPTLTSPSRGRRISRRLVLGAALTGGAGVAAVRALGLDRAIHPTGVTSSSGKLDWISPLANEQAKVTHLLRRTTFGASGSQLEAAQAAGFSKTIDQILETPTAQPPPFPSADTASRSTPLNLAKLQQWWVSHILTTPTPFAERMTLFWHGHFTSDYRKVGLQDPFIYWQNLTWRDMALTDFGSILMRVTIDPAMLRYLDLATSTGASPNENFSRELMELFTLGVGNYTEDDVRAAAKGLAGWREPNPAGVIKGQFNSTFPAPPNYKPPVADSAKTGIYVPSRAYKGGPITFLGKNGSFNTQAILAQILSQNALAPFIVTKVLQHFVMPNPDSAYVNRLAATFRSSRYDVKTLMRNVFTSPEFVSDQSYRALVKSPTEFMVHAIRALTDPQLSSLMLPAAQGMGQVLFDPPDVGGWPNNDSWISSSTALARINFVSSLLAKAKSLPAADQAYRNFLDGVLSSQTADLLNQATDDRSRWQIVLMSPEFQLK